MRGCPVAACVLGVVREAARLENSLEVFAVSSFTEVAIGPVDYH